MVFGVNLLYYTWHIPFCIAKLSSHKTSPFLLLIATDLNNPYYTKFGDVFA